jgi:hypothetical protein
MRTIKKIQLKIAQIKSLRASGKNIEAAIYKLKRMQILYCK